MNQAGPPPRSQSADDAQRETIAVMPPRSNNSVSVAHDFLLDIPNNADLLSDPLPLDVNHYQQPPSDVDDEFSPNKPPTYEAIWSSIMDAYDSGGGGTNQTDP